MPLNTLGVLDLSIVTDRLIRMLGDCRDQSPLWKANGGDVDQFAITITGAAPDTVRDLGGCQLSLYLFHVTQDPYQRNSPVVGPRAQPIPLQPLSLDLYYLLSAFSQSDYHQEQQAMSIALRCFHEHPIVRTTVTIPVPPPQTVNEEFTLTMEVETVDSLARLWQSITSSMRLATMYKVSVVFITPPAPTVPQAPHVKQIGLAAAPTTLPFAQNGQMIGTYRKVTYTSPHSSPASPEIVSFDSSTATAAPGQILILYGAGLSNGQGQRNPTAQRLYMLTSTGTEQEVTNWIVADPNPHPPPPTTVLDARLTLQLPSTIGVPPQQAPDPGVYQLRVGSDAAAGDAVTYRSNAVPISIAAAVTVTTVAPNPPILSAFTFSGVGFISGRTELLLDTVALTEGAPLPGHFQIVAGTTITFQPPSGLPPGLYAVRVRVNQVESDPAWWALI
jgi:hypothetical protein